MTLALVLGALVAVVAVLAIARPFLREPASRSDRLEEIDERLLDLEEERDRALAALKELEFDHRTGKVSDDDYRELVGPLRRQAAALLETEDSPSEQEVSLPSEGVTTLPQPPGAPDVPVPEPAPVPHEPPSQPDIPEPYPQPATPPAPVTVPEPSPVPHEPPSPAA